MNTIKIDADLCDGCMTCYDCCFVDVFRWDDQADRPIAAYPEDCVECNKCELSCSQNAIEVFPDFAAVYWPPVI